jgi:ATP-dependent DNA helicase RecQ
MVLSRNAPLKRRGVFILHAHKRELPRNGALREWVRKRFDQSGDNPWLEMLDHCVLELDDAWRGTPIPISQVRDWVYEYGGESRYRVVGRITLSTVHGAKNNWAWRMWIEVASEI